MRFTAVLLALFVAGLAEAALSASGPEQQAYSCEHVDLVPAQERCSFVIEECDTGGAPGRKACSKHRPPANQPCATQYPTAWN